MERAKRHTENKVIHRSKTGIFFPYFEGERLADFPRVLGPLLAMDNTVYYDGWYENRKLTGSIKPVDERTLARVHTLSMINEVKRTGLYEPAMYSTAGTVQAAVEIAEGHINNAFVFTGFGDHHAGRDFFGGFCYFNGAAVAIEILREKGLSRFAVIDTDSHHGDGTRDIFLNDPDVLHLCFCFRNYRDSHNNRDIAIPARTNDEEYFDIARRTFSEELAAFKPEVIFWEFGYDATSGEYGDKGISSNFHLELAGLIKNEADRICSGRLICILCGGSSRDLATYIIPRLIGILARPQEL